MSILNRHMSARAAVIALGLIFLSGTAYAGEVFFGHVSSTTHTSSAFNAKELQAGIKLAFDAANADGGINKNTLKL